MFGMWHSVNVLQYACKSSCCMTFYKWGGEAISEGVKVSPSPSEIVRAFFVNEYSCIAIHVLHCVHTLHSTLKISVAVEKM